MKFLAFLVLFVPLNIVAQDLENIVLAASDADQLTQQYLEPALEGLIYSMNAGWYTTAKTHDTWGFDLTISGNLAFVPDARQTFLFKPSDYTFLGSPSGQNLELPTVVGKDGNGTILDVRVPVGDGTFKVAEFEMPGGVAEDLPASAVPLPMVQLGLGLPTGTDLKIRYVPQLDYDDKISSGLIGVGLQHDITQYFKGLNESPFHMSILGAYTTTKTTYLLGTDANNTNVTVTNGEAVLQLDTWTLQALGSLDYKFISFYGGFGYNQGASEIRLDGSYNLSYRLEDEKGNQIGVVSETIVDPIANDATIGGVRATIGTRLNLSIFKIFADYTIQDFNTLSAGIAISVR